MLSSSSVDIPPFSMENPSNNKGKLPYISSIIRYSEIKWQNVIINHKSFTIFA